MLNLEEILHLTAKGVVQRADEDAQLLHTEIESRPDFKALWEHIESTVKAAASKGMYYCSLRIEGLPQHATSDIHKVSRVLHSSGFIVDTSKTYLTIRWAENALAINHYSLKYGRVFL